MYEKSPSHIRMKTKQESERDRLSEKGAVRAPVGRENIFQATMNKKDKKVIKKGRSHEDEKRIDI